MTVRAYAPAEFTAVFLGLKQILQAYEPYLIVAANDPGDYYLNTGHIQPNRQPLFFGAVQIKKNYVSFHLMPLYVCPALLTDLAPALRARMQGKACFNFKKDDPALLEELARLTRAGFAEFKSRGWIDQAPQG